jgi:hypothetical protein
VELEAGTPAEVAARIEKVATDDERKKWQDGTAEQWALESLAIVRVQVYRLSASGEISGRLRQTGTRCDSYSVSAIGSEIGVVAEQDVSVNSALQRSYIS